jgi:DNA-binding MarR family transcriptional regulator
MATMAAVKSAPDLEPVYSEDEISPLAGRPDPSRSHGLRSAQLGGACGLSRSEPDELSVEELRAWRGLLRTHASLAKLLDAELEAQHGLPMTSYEVLHHLEGAERGRMRMCDLAEQAQLSRSGLTRLVDRLERDGLIERCSCEHDARGAYACLTQAGSEVLCKARSTHRSLVREHFLSRFSAQELQSLASLWERIAPDCGCKAG